MTKNKKKNKKNAKESIGENADIEMGDSEKSLDVDDPELSKWCNEGSDQETSDRYKQLTSQLEELCQKEMNKTPKKKKQEPTISIDKPGKESKKVNSESIKDVDKPANLPNETGKNKKRKRKTSELTGSNPTLITTEETTKKSKKPKMEAEIIPEETNSTSRGKKSKIAKDTKTKGTTSLMHNPKEPTLKAETTPPDNVVPGVKKQKQKLVFMNAEGVVKLSKTQKRNLLRRKHAEKEKKGLKKEVSANVSTAEINDEATRNPNLIESDLPKKKKEHARRKELPENLLILNGEEVEIVTLHGFPITSKDGERIQELRKSLISKGIPRSEVERTIKLERRKAEKSLARLKKNMCFHCRKGGHILAECPELNKDGSKSSLPSSGLCFKCGSTEHTHFACKVVRTQDYKFASCFICKEQVMKNLLFNHFC